MEQEERSGHEARAKYVSLECIDILKRWIRDEPNAWFRTELRQAYETVLGVGINVAEEIRPGLYTDLRDCKILKM